MAARGLPSGGGPAGVPAEEGVEVEQRPPVGTFLDEKGAPLPSASTAGVPAEERVEVLESPLVSLLFQLQEMFPSVPPEVIMPIHLLLNCC